jgi:hypothetical protein
MARSICLKCGQSKGEPLAFCPHCGFVPEDLHDRARSILLSDAHRTADQLADAARQIRGRRILMFDNDELRPVLARLGRTRAGRFLGLRKSTWLVIGASASAGALAGLVTILVQNG